MRKQTFFKIGKTIGILLAVILVVTLTVASASACSSKPIQSKLVKTVSEPPVNTVTESPVSYPMTGYGPVPYDYVFVPCGCGGFGGWC